MKTETVNTGGHFHMLGAHCASQQVLCSFLPGLFGVIGGINSSFLAFWLSGVKTALTRSCHVINSETPTALNPIPYSKHLPLSHDECMVK